jgi:predicted RNase H-like nuclease (RuvC/YqgF family)
MNKDQLQKELKEKIKAGIKPSDLKKQSKKQVKKDNLPPPISIGSDEGYESDKSNKSIPTPPPLPSQIQALQKKIEIQEAIKKADEKKKQELQEKIKTLIKLAGKEKQEYQQKISDLEQQVQDLDYLLRTGKNSDIIKKLQAKIKEQDKTIEELKKQVKNKEEIKEPTKSFFCDACQLTKQGTYIERKADAPFEPRLHRRTCYLCPSCSPYIKELSEPNYDPENNPYKY